MWPQNSKGAYKREARGSETEDVMTLALKMEEGVTRRGRRALVEAGKGQGTDSSREPPEGMQPCPHPDCSPVRLILDFIRAEPKTMNLGCF